MGTKRLAIGLFAVLLLAAAAVISIFVHAERPERQHDHAVISEEEDPEVPTAGERKPGDGAAKRDLQVEFAGSEGAGTVRHVPRDTEPFHYELKSDDPVFAMLLRAQDLDASFRENWWTFTGEAFRLEIAFTKDVDRASAEAKFRDLFGDHAWAAHWPSSREVVLTVELLADKAPYPVILDLGGIPDQDGNLLVDPRPLQIYHHAGFRYGLLDPATMQRKELFRFSQPIFAFLPNDDGTLALAQISQQDETGPSLYVLLDLNRGGEIREVYRPGQIQYPQWVRDRSSFLYASQQGGTNVVEIRNALTGETETVWTSPHHGGNHDGLRWARPYAVPGETRWFVMDHRTTSPGYGFSYTADLYEWEAIEDDTPVVLRDFQQGRCEGMACFAEFKVGAGGIIAYSQLDEDAAQAPYYWHWFYHPAGHIREELQPGPEIDLADLTVHPLDQNRVLLVQENRSEQSLSFHVYHPWEKWLEHSFDAEEGAVASPLGPMFALGNELFLAGSGEKGVQIDLAQRRLTQIAYQPVAQAGQFIYWAETLK